jgi:hypothetical protein
VTHLLENLVHTSHPLSAVRYSTPYIPSATLELRQQLSSSPNASCGQPLKKTATLGPKLANPASTSRFLATLSLYLATSPPTCLLPTHSHRPSQSSTIIGRISILPHCSGPLHVLARSFPYSQHHSTGSVMCPTLRLDIKFRLSTDHHNQERQFKSQLFHNLAKLCRMSPPPSFHQWSRGKAALHTESHCHVPCG